MLKPLRYVVVLLVLASPLTASLAFAGPKHHVSKTAQKAAEDTKAIDEALDAIDLEIETAALDAVLIDAEPTENIFPVDTNHRRSAQADPVVLKNKASPYRPSRKVRR